LNRFLLAAAFLLLAPALTRAENVDNKDDSSFVGQGRLFRFDYANDYFTGTDRYYTQGIGMTYFDPVLRASPLMRVLVALPGEKSYGLVLRQSGFTPTNLGHKQTIIGDRPFACYLFLGHILVSRDPEHRLTLTAELDTGVIGPAAGGEWEQVGIHQATDNNVPLGWGNQIRTDVVLDYYARLDKTLAAVRWADIGVLGDATAGTLYDNASIGVVGRLGAIDSGKNRFFLLLVAEQKAVGYDATLQGGLTDRQSPYTLTTPQIRRRVSREDVGVTLDRGSYALEAKRTYLSSEFTNQFSHEWVEISFIKRF
jgi:lipid A 3-O-deacylase